MSRRGRTLIGAAAACTVLGIAPFAGVAHAASRPWVDLTPAAALSPDAVGDLDGDGHADLIETRGYVDQNGSATSEPRSIGARRGVDGKLLWRRQLLASSYAEIIPTHIGTPARPGVLLVEHEVHSYDDNDPGGESSGFAITRIHVHALDGRTGAQLWEWQSQRGYVLYPTLVVYQDVNRTVIPAVLPASNGATDVLLGLTDRGVNHFFILSGANGGSRDVCNGPDCSWSSARPIADIDGDKRADLLLSTRTNSTYTISARSSATFTQVWSHAGVSRWGTATDVNRDGRADLHAQFTRTNNEILDVRTGRKLTTLGVQAPPAMLESVGDADADGVSDFVYEKYPQGMCGANLIALSAGAGHILWRQSLAVPMSECGNTYVSDAADVTGDRVRDWYVDRTTEAGVEHDYLVNGRTGVVTDGRNLGTPLGAAVDTHGADFAEVPGTKNDNPPTVTLKVTVRDGMSRAAVWTFDEARSRARNDYFGYHSWIYALNLTADRNAEVVVHTERVSDNGAEVIVLNGATGKPLWRITS
jgi:hypothetical protein